jgi:hypothetical protein
VRAGPSPCFAKAGFPLGWRPGPSLPSTDVVPIRTKTVAGRLGPPADRATSCPRAYRRQTLFSSFWIDDAVHTPAGPLLPVMWQIAAVK